MILKETDGWKIFTILCLVSLLGVMEYRGMIDLISDEKSEQVEDKEQITKISSTADEMHPFGEYCLTEHGESVQMHIHPYLTIIIDGEEQEIPKDAGIYTETCPNAMHMVHTHDNTGKLHVENYTWEDVPLEVFFDVWGKHFNETGIFDHRDGIIEMTVNGTVNDDYQNLILADKQNIVIIYTSNQGA
tara:strand:- start:15 stop:578 length:564 start_codon:yes stop_codon:yes gene_type:complete